MKATELMAALNLVEQDHELVLEKVQGLREIVACLVGPAEADVPRILARLREIDGYFTTQMLAHMDEEEATLFPLLEEDKPEGADLAARLRLEHAEIRRRLEAFGDCLHVAGELEDGGLPRAVLRDLLSCGWELWELLDDHARTETRGVQRCIRFYLGAGAGAR
jgi:Hemerythrin HHE cation binding domain